MNPGSRRQFIQRAGLAFGTAGCLPANLIAAEASNDSERPARATAQTLDVDFSRHGLSFEGSGIKLRRAQPRATLRVGSREEVVELCPADLGLGETRVCSTFCGPAHETTRVRKDARGYVVRWTLRQLQQRAGFTLRLASRLQLSFQHEPSQSPTIFRRSTF